MNKPFKKGQALPNAEDIRELMSFETALCASGFSPILEKTNDAQGESATWPQYEGVVEDFFRAASKECWRDYDYVPKLSSEMVSDSDRISTATMSEFRTMLTYCARGERFSSGFWATVIEDGTICRLLQRLRQLQGL